jgi:SHS2 domain-containing protein
MEWKALPQRKRFKVSDDPSSTHQPDPIPVPLVEARDKVNTDDRLEALDGVAGEFFEYLDHTADVQCHAWGATLNEAFQNTALCMVNYMTDLSRIEVDPEEGVSFECAGHDLESLLFKFLDEILYRFCTDSFCPKTLSVKVDTETYAAQVDM